MKTMKKTSCIYLLLLFTGLIAVGNAGFLSSAAPDTDTGVMYHIPKRNSTSSIDNTPFGGNRRRLQGNPSNTGSSSTTISGDSSAANGTTAPDNTTSTDNNTSTDNSTTTNTTTDNSTTNENSTTGNSTNSTDNSIGSLPGDNSTNTSNSTNSTDNNLNGTAAGSNVTCTNNSDGSSSCTNASVNCTTNPDGSVNCTNITNVCQNYTNGTSNCTNATTQSLCVNNTDGSTNCTNTTTTCINNTDGSQNCTNSTSSSSSSGNNSTSTDNSTTVVSGDNGTTTTNSSNSTGSNSSSNSGAGSNSASCATNADLSITCISNSVVCANNSDGTSNCTNMTSTCTNYTNGTMNCVNTTDLCMNNTAGSTNCTNTTVQAACVNNTDGSMICTDNTEICTNDTNGTFDCIEISSICTNNTNSTINCTNGTTQGFCFNNSDGSTSCSNDTVSCMNNTDGSSSCTNTSGQCTDYNNGTMNCTSIAIQTDCINNSDGTSNCTNTTVICITNPDGNMNCSNGTDNSTTVTNTTNTTNTTNNSTGLPDGTQVSVGNCDDSCQSCFGPSKYECNGCYSNATLVWIGTIGICAPKGDSSVVSSGSGVTYPSTNLSICTTNWMTLVDCARLTESYLENLYMGHFVTYENGVQTIAIQANSNSDICMTCMLVNLVIVNQNLTIIPIPYTVVATTSPVGTTNYTFMASISNADLAGFGCYLTQPDANTTMYSCDMQLIFTALNTTTSFYDFNLVTYINNNVIDDLSVSATLGGSNIGGPTGSTGDNTSVINVTQHNETSNCLSGSCQTNITSVGTINLCADSNCTSNKSSNVYTSSDSLIIQQTIYDLQGFNFTLTKVSILALDPNDTVVADLTSATNQTQGLLNVVYSIPLAGISGQVTFSITSMIVAYNPPALRRHLQSANVYLNSERTTKVNIIVDSSSGLTAGSASTTSVSWWIIGAILIGALIIIAILIICIFQAKKDPKKGKKGSLPRVKFDPVMTIPNRV